MGKPTKPQSHEDVYGPLLSGPKTRTVQITEESGVNIGGRWKREGGETAKVSEELCAFICSHGWGVDVTPDATQMETSARDLTPKRVTADDVLQLSGKVS